MSALINSTAAAAAKRKGSFKKWLRSSHRKFTSNGTNTSRLNTKNDNPQQKTLNLSSSSDLKVRIHSYTIRFEIEREEFFSIIMICFF